MFNYGRIQSSGFKSDHNAGDITKYFQVNSDDNYFVSEIVFLYHE